MKIFSPVKVRAQKGKKKTKHKNMRTRQGEEVGKQLSTSFFNEEKGRMTITPRPHVMNKVLLLGGMKDSPQPLTLS